MELERAEDCERKHGTRSNTGPRALLGVTGVFSALAYGDQMSNRARWGCALAVVVMAVGSVSVAAAFTGGSRPGPWLVPARVLALPDSVSACDLAADGSRAVFDCSLEVDAWSADTGRRMKVADDECVTFCAGLVVGSSGVVYVSAYEGNYPSFRQVWLVRPSRHQAVALTGELRAFSEGASDLNVRGEGRIAAFNTWSKGKVGLWVLAGGQARVMRSDADAARVVDVERGVIAVRRADGRIALLRGDGSLIRLLSRIRGGGAQSVQMDGRWLVLQQGRWLEVYDAERGVSTASVRDARRR
jgi:hypothetical protein